ncbi:MAG: PhzF family phenazine biosynthesis protein [Legionellales bacterium]
MPDLYQVKSFSNERSQGNLAGVVTCAESLSDVDMQCIATFVGASETVFILPSAKADFHFRWFTPNTEVGMCVHATIAALGVMKTEDKILKEIIHIETKHTILVSRIREDNIFIDIPGYQLISRSELNANVLSFLTLSPSQLVGMPGIIKIFDDRELIIEVKSFDDLRHLKPTQQNYSEVCRSLKVTGISIFTQKTLDPSNQIHTREFAPLYGYLEDPLCGMAAGAISTYLGSKKPLRVEQGYFCDTSGIILVESGEENTISVGGTCCISEHIPDFDIPFTDGFSGF